MPLQNSIKLNKIDADISLESDQEKEILDEKKNLHSDSDNGDNKKNKREPLSKKKKIVIGAIITVMILAIIIGIVMLAIRAGERKSYLLPQKFISVEKQVIDDTFWGQLTDGYVIVKDGETISKKYTYIERYTTVLDTEQFFYYHTSDNYYGHLDDNGKEISRYKADGTFIVGSMKENSYPFYYKYHNDKYAVYSNGKYVGEFDYVYKYAEFYNGFNNDNTKGNGLPTNLLMYKEIDDESNEDSIYLTLASDLSKKLDFTKLMQDKNYVLTQSTVSIFDADLNKYSTYSLKDLSLIEELDGFIPSGTDKLDLKKEKSFISYKGDVISTQIDVDNKVIKYKSHIYNVEVDADEFVLYKAENNNLLLTAKKNNVLIGYVFCSNDGKAEFFDITSTAIMTRYSGSDKLYQLADGNLKGIIFDDNLNIISRDLPNLTQIKDSYHTYYTYVDAETDYTHFYIFDGNKLIKQKELLKMNVLVFKQEITEKTTNFFVSENKVYDNQFKMKFETKDSSDVLLPYGQISPVSDYPFVKLEGDEETVFSLNGNEFNAVDKVIKLNKAYYSEADLFIDYIIVDNSGVAYSYNGGEIFTESDKFNYKNNDMVAAYYGTGGRVVVETSKKFLYSKDTSVRFDSFVFFASGYYAVIQDNSIITYTGNRNGLQEIARRTFDSKPKFIVNAGELNSYGLVYQVNNKYGYISIDAKIELEPVYDNIQITPSMVVVEYKENIAIFNHKGKSVTKFDRISSDAEVYNEFIFVASKTNLTSYELLDKKGKVVLSNVMLGSYQYQIIASFTEDADMKKVAYLHFTCDGFVRVIRVDISDYYYM